eukprot:GHVU01065613.1.p4 GENE.GHVU01065613.1~~GHVU01065613.1.p4  ORF type:complete len:136 (-),score=29.36 GHVU01065613.1:237-644(-)
MKDSATGKVTVHGKEGNKLIMTKEVITFYDSDENVLNVFPVDGELPPQIGDDSLTDATMPFIEDAPARQPATDLREGQQGSGAPSFVEIPRALLFDQREQNHQERQRQIRTDQKDDGGQIQHEQPHAAFQRNGRQ